ncbi:hypothetical protein IAD21_01552 [Abditibacteriota bacterium]|nr:hypothetical protein IAD21_01552 [Abditibacteriota bacterium]
MSCLALISSKEKGDAISHLPLVLEQLITVSYWAGPYTSASEVKVKVGV